MSRNFACNTSSLGAGSVRRQSSASYRTYSGTRNQSCLLSAAEIKRDEDNTFQIAQVSMALNCVKALTSTCTIYAPTEQLGYFVDARRATQQHLAKQSNYV